MRGFIVDSPKEVAAGTAMIAGEAVVGAASNVASSATFGFTSRGSFLAHANQHAGEFGLQFAEQYRMAASRYRHSGERRVQNKAGKTVTCHKASAKYWAGQLRRYSVEILQAAAQ